MFSFVNVNTARGDLRAEVFDEQGLIILPPAFDHFEQLLGGGDRPLPVIDVSDMRLHGKEGRDIIAVFALLELRRQIKPDGLFKMVEVV